MRTNPIKAMWREWNLVRATYNLAFAGTAVKLPLKTNDPFYGA